MDARCSPVLEYTRPPPDPAARTALKASWMLAGSVAYVLFTVGVFFLSTRFAAPDLLFLMPLLLLAAGTAASVDGFVTRCLGVGAILGGVAVTTVGYTAGMLLLIHA
jgi:hypothetical protein